MSNATKLREKILSRAKKQKEKIVHIPEWDMDVLLIGLSGTVRGDYFAFVADVTEKHSGTGEFFKRVWFEQVRLGCHDPESREPIFQPADRDMFMSDEDGALIETLSAMVRELSGINLDVLEEAKKKLHSHESDTAITNSENGTTQETSTNC
ncbi:hypothetical protein KSF_096010 [Reticulibacter mediterranei]|uniref:Uncharacterized protein n=1 Tax=Reticulibacter mediterranei TaxID=2778369 RepID=A0A8J3IVZ1_9CHLR|nr:hypothetical protein [Reticulibacter mediterranei]GHO99553.1 hypothetical protein KSF_096010 [Reticulibacter mediterranei]